ETEMSLAAIEMAARPLHLTYTRWLEYPRRTVLRTLIGTRSPEREGPIAIQIRRCCREKTGGANRYCDIGRGPYNCTGRKRRSEGCRSRRVYVVDVTRGDKSDVGQIPGEDRNSGTTARKVRSRTKRCTRRNS